jgi:hypothetical protein
MFTEQTVYNSIFYNFLSISSFSFGSSLMQKIYSGAGSESL